MNALLRDACATDIPQLTGIFRAAVLETASRDYDPAQIAVWAARGTAERFTELFASGLRFFMAEEDGQARGFVSISRAGYLHSLFVAPAFQRQGVASALLKKAIDYAREHDAGEITTESSLTALPFFQSMGFVMARPQTVLLDGVSLKNYALRKPL